MSAAPSPSHRYWVQTFGCQMNVHDSDRMEEVLRAHGWTAAAEVESADLIVLNTCSVREKAEQKLRSEVGKLAPLKARRPELVVAVAGCVAQQEGEKLLQWVKHLDLVIGPDNIPELPALALEQIAGAIPVARTVFDLDAPRFLAAQPVAGKAPVSAFVTTMKGCDERCSFCIVPYTRGPERYRPAHEIVGEVARWVEAGAREVTLLGQTVDSYRDPSLPPPASDDPDETQFPELLRRIARDVPGLARLRYTSPHPRHATPSLAAAHAELDVLARHVHLPSQSGSDRMLKRMIRRYTRAEYIERAARLRAARADMTLSTDIIVGFSGETDADFEATLSFVREAGFTSLFGFKYSVRPHTPAQRLPDDVSEEVKSERLARLFELAEAQGRAHLATLVGTRQRVLVEGPSKSGTNRVEGRTERNEIVHVEAGPELSIVGAIVEVTIVRANKHSLEAELTEASRAALPRVAASTEPRRRSLQVLSEGAGLMALYEYRGVRPTLGERVFVAPNATVIGDVILGDQASVWFSAVIRGDVMPIRIGARTNIQDGSVVHVTSGKASTTVGDDVTVGHMVLLHGCTIGHRCLVGMGSIVLDKAEVGDECVIAAGTLVAPGTKILPRSLVMGRPGKVVREVTDKDLAWIMDSGRAYLEAGETFRSDAVKLITP